MGARLTSCALVGLKYVSEHLEAALILICCFLVGCYSIGVTVRGLSGSGLVVQNNGDDNLTVNGDGTFTFGNEVSSGSTYFVTVLTQPAGQTCAVVNGWGIVSSIDISISVKCQNLLALPGNAIAPTDNVNGLSPGPAAGQFGVDSSGDANYVYPIWTPPGRLGIEPHLALSYNSGAGNGILGVGWSLQGLSTITRCKRDLARDGKNAAIQFDETDAFCLDGQRLIAVAAAGSDISTAPGKYGAAGTEYRIEEQGFARIISGSANDPSSVDGNGPLWFEVQLKDGRRLFYGTTANSRLEGNRFHSRPPTSGNPAEGVVPDVSQTVRLSWSLSEVRDWFGNNLTIQYSLAGDPVSQGYEQLPQSIIYTGTAEGVSPQLIPQRTVSFIYEPRCDTSFTPHCDYSSAFVSGLMLGRYQRLKQIVLSAPNPSDVLTVKYYAFSYKQSPATGRSRLTRIAECDPSGVCLSPTSFEYSPNSPFGELLPVSFSDVDTGIHDATATSESTQPVGPKLDRLLVGDFNGDGCDDFIYTVRDPSAPLGLPDPSFAGVYELSSCYDAINSGQPPFVAHSPGDSLYQVSPPNGGWPSANVPAWFFEHTFCVNAIFYAGCVYNEPLALDLDLDGRTDLLNYNIVLAASPYSPAPYGTAFVTTAIAASSITPSLWTPSNGLFGGTSTPWADSIDDVVPWITEPAAPFYSSIYVGDINGDGFPDIIHLSPDGWSYQLNRGRTFVDPSNQYGCGNFGAPCISFDSPSQFVSALAPTSPLGNVFMVDVYAEGTTDLLLRDSSSPQYASWYAAYNVDSQTGRDIALAAGDSYPSPRRDWFVDFNGDGLPDSISIPSGGGHPFISVNSGNGFATPAKMSVHPTPSSDNNLVFDVDGNGTQDLVYSDGSTLHALLTYGNGSDGSLSALPLLSAVPLLARSSDQTVNPIPAGSNLEAFDVNGDGLIDLVQTVNGSIHVYIRQGPRPDLMSTIADRGTNISVNYSPITSAAVYHTTVPPGVAQLSPAGFVSNSTYVLNRGLWVVNSYTVKSGWDSPKAYNYSYADARRDLRGRGWLGFGSVTSTNLQTGEATTTAFDNGTALKAAYPFAKRPYMQNAAVTLSGSGLTHEKAIDTAYQTVTTSGVVVLPQKVSQKEFEGGGSLTINWLVQPSGDPGRFNLQIDGTTYVSDVRNGGSTGPQAVIGGPHIVTVSGGSSTNLLTYAVLIGGDCDTLGRVTVGSGSAKTCTITMNGAEPVVCAVFDDSYQNEVGPSGATYISGSRQDFDAACVPNPGPFGFCHTLFGGCHTVNTNVPVDFHVFDDDGQNDGGLSDSVFILNQSSSSQACLPPLTAPICRHRFGNAHTRDGRSVECAVFDDGGANLVRDPSVGIFIPDTLPQGGAACTGPASAPICRRWFGQCQAE